MSHNYQATKPISPVNPPWRLALGGKPISKHNAIGYTNALKRYITPAMRRLIFDYQNWNAAQAGWYNQPWLADIREPIHGATDGKCARQLTQQPF